MLLHLDPHGGPPIYQQIIEQVQRLILGGQLRAGDQVEQVRALAERLRVNPMTVSKAYGLLERDGFLERRRGIGLFVATVGRETERRVRDRFLDDAFRKAAAAALQMGLSAKDSHELLDEMLRRFRRDSAG
ncbi:MAG: GntR family transcriptional regulator [Lentisphaeria bacterium]